MDQKRGGVPKRKKAQILEDYKFIIPLFLKGKGVTEIAGLLGKEREYRVAPQTVWGDINQILKEWQKERMDMIDSQMMIDLKKIDQLEVTYWESWEESKKSKVKTVQKERSIYDKKKKARVGDLTNQQAEKHTTEFVGDKKWLEGVQWCIMQRAELLRYKHVQSAGAEDAIPAARDVVFVTRTRKNDHIQEAIEITGTPDDGLPKLLSI